MKRPPLLVLALILILLSCSPIQKESPAADTSPTPTAESTDTRRLPEVELTPELLYGLLVAEIAGQRGDLQDAAGFYLEAAKITRDPRVAERATRIALFARDKDRAIAGARLWTELDPESMEARQILVLLLLNEGQQDEALTHLEKLTAPQGTPAPERLLEMAALLGRVQDERAALALMERFASRYPELPEALLAHAVVALHAGEAQRAMELADQALARRPDWPDATVFRARLLQQKEKTDEALAYLKGQVDRYPQERALQLNYARLLVDARRFDEAITQFESLAKAAPEDDEVLFALGLLSLQTNRDEDAQNYLTRLVESGKRVFEASYFLGQIAESKKQFDKAEEWYSRVQGGEYYFDSQIRLAAVAARRGDIDGALSQLKALQARDSEEAVRVYLAQAEILTDADQLKQALAVYNGALEKFPDHADLLYARALLAERMNLIAQAEEDLGRVLTKDPDNPQALNALGYTLADRTDRYQEALGHIQRALNLRPNDGYILDSMGWVQYKLGNYPAAITYLRRAMELQQDPEVAAHLGEVLWVSGDKDQARKVWEEALQEHPDSQPLREVMQRFTP